MMYKKLEEKPVRLWLNVFILGIILLTTSNSYSQFNSSFVNWSVPPEHTEENGGLIAASVSSWSTFDINGDGLPDMVLSGDANYPDPQVYGIDDSPYWKVHLNTGNGFSASPIMWYVPPVHTTGNGGLFMASNSTLGFGGYWSTMDMNGDGLPDMVLTADWTPTHIHVYGIEDNPHWKVHLNTGSGFSTSPIIWSVPAEHTTEYDGLNQTSSNQYSDGGAWSTIDINADGLPDMILTGESNNFTSIFDVYGIDENPHWKVHLNTGNGFSESPIIWSVPPEHAADHEGLFSTSASDWSDGGSWSTMDINGDELPDMVLTGEDFLFQSEVYGLDDVPHWKVHLNTGNGFSDSLIIWSVPPEHTAEDYGLFNVSNADFGDGGFWSTLDINGDGLPDMVLTADYDPFPFQVYGIDDNPHWKVYLNTGNGFSTSPFIWSVPPEHTIDNGGLYLTNNWEFLVQDGGIWSTFDINGDGSPDMVLTGVDIPPMIQVYDMDVYPHWRVYLNDNAILSVEEENSHSTLLNSFPNPTDDITYIDLNQIKTFNTKVYNHLGELIYEEQEKKERIVLLSLSNYSAGMYYVIIESNGEMFTTKVIKN